jgi:hypothetical protein
MADVARSRQQIVHERTGEELTLGVIGEFLKQRAAQSLHRAAENLAFHQHRVHHHAAVMHDNIFLDVEPPGPDVDFDDGRM